MVYEIGIHAAFLRERSRVVDNAMTTRLLG
jgi:hypothetical protein